MENMGIVSVLLWAGSFSWVAEALPSTHSVNAPSSKVTAVQTLSVPILLDEAQIAYNERANFEKGWQAVHFWQTALETDPANYEALWKLARAHRWLGDHSQDNEKLDIYSKGKDYAERAVRANPDGVWGHYWLGACLGKYGETKGVFKSLMLVGPIRDEMEKVLKLDSAHAGANYILGALYRKAPGRPLGIGNKKKSLQYAKKAVELDPASVRYAVGLGEAYLAVGNRQEAKEVLEEVLKMPPNPEYIPESLDDKEIAQKLLLEMKERQ
ncbi:MAG: tetratricopeptide repeat protein [Elusimicrobiota bacterium]